MQHKEIAEFLESKKSNKNPIHLIQKSPKTNQTLKSKSRSFIGSLSKTATKAVEHSHKLYNDAIERNGKVQKIITQRNLQEKKEVTFAPRIDKKSKQIASQKKMPPIYERYQEIMREKDKKIQFMKEKVMEIEREKHPEDFYFDFKPSLDISQMVVPKGNRTFDNFINEIETWHQRKKKEIQRKVEEKEKTELKKLLPKPIICENTIKLFEGKERPNFVERGEEYLEKINTKRREKIEHEMDGFFFPITENRIKELRSRSTFDGTRNNLTLSNWSPSPIAKGPMQKSNEKKIKGK